jgi:hypothetical protein
VTQKQPIGFAEEYNWMIFINSGVLTKIRKEVQLEGTALLQETPIIDENLRIHHESEYWTSPVFEWSIWPITGYLITGPFKYQTHFKWSASLDHLINRKGS